MTPFVDDGDMRLYVGDCLDVLRQLPDESVDCCVTSPPYWGLRDYETGEWDGGDPDCDHGVRRWDGPKQTQGAQSGHAAQADRLDRDVCGKCGARRVDRQLGLEPTPDQYVQNIVAVFREVRRVLAPHGTCWVNLGDSYHGGGGGNYGDSKSTRTHNEHLTNVRNRIDLPGLKPKDLVGIPWRVAFALQADGWWLRSDIVWSKPNPMPESVTDRPTKAHEYLFLLTKAPRYWFDAEAVREPHNHDGRKVTVAVGKENSVQHRNGERWPGSGRNVRSVWEIATQPFPGAHFATFPEELARRCIVAGCPAEVCRVCGKPRERIVEREASAAQRENYAGRGIVPVHRGGGDRPGGYYPDPPQTIGWSDCGHNAYRPGRVLDPFAGAGTVGLVARKHARHSVLIELSEQYAREILLPRLSQLSLLAEIV